MNKRPLSITVIGWVFICVGCVSLSAGVWRFFADNPHAHAGMTNKHDLADFAFASSSGLLAVAGGAFVLRGFNWARWILVAWMGGHVVLSILHSPFELAVHSLLFAVLLYYLLRPRATAYFRGTTPT